MRRTLFTVLASAAMFVAVPSAALAHDGGNGAGNHHHARHHFRVRHEHFVAHRHDEGNPANDGTAGTVTAFGNGSLTITLNNGNTVTGAVTDATEFKCESGTMMTTNDRGPSGDNSGDRGDNGDRGDDNGDHDQGDDNGNDNANACGPITDGMVVRDASLTITHAGAVWNEVELINS